MQSTTTLDKTLIVIMAHGGAQEIYSRHLPFWQAHRCPMLTFCPVDDKVIGPGKVVAWGAKGHHDPHSLDRFKYLLKLLSIYPYDYFFLFEYDAICTSPEIPKFLYEKDALWCNRFTDSGTQFLGSQYLHPPLFFSKSLLHRVVAAGEKYPQHSEQYFWDRWIGLICELEQIPAVGYGPLGFAWNTIEPHLIPHAEEAAEGGVIFWHGVKSIEALEVITK